MSAGSSGRIISLDASVKKLPSPSQSTARGSGLFDAVMRASFPSGALRATVKAMSPGLVRALGVTLVLASAVASSTGRAQGFVSFDAVAERVIVGRLPVADAQRVADAQPIARGAFVVDDASLRMVQPAPFGESTWLARGVPFASGIVRARFKVGARLDSAVLVRATHTDDGELVSGLGVSIERNKTLRIVRYVERGARPLGSEAKIEQPLVAGGEVELVVLVSGPAIMADLYDGATLRLIAHVAAHDSGTVSGVVGVRVNKAQDKDSHLVFLASSTQPGPLGMRADDGAYDQRVVSVPRASVLPKDLAARVYDHTDDATWLHVDVRDTERLRRLGLARTVSARVPYRAVDPSLRRARGPVAETLSGLRVDEGYKDVRDVEAILDAYAQRFPHLARLHAIGTTTQGRTLWALEIGAGDDRARRPAVLLDGAHHAGELPSTEIVLDAIQQLLERYETDARTRRWLDALTIWCVPLVNPDGLDRFIYEDREDDRKNGAGVDLYRNYPTRWGALGEVGSRSFARSSRYRGPAPASEPETRAMVALAERERFVASIDFHTAATVILPAYTDPELQGPTPNEVWAIAEELARAAPVQSNKKRFVVQKNLYAVDGTAQDHFRFAHGTAALLVEMPVHNPLPYEDGRRRSVAGVRPTWQRLLDRVLDGPRVSGVVVDEQGAPLEAEVTLDAVTLRDGERWTSRPRDGRFDRLLTERRTTTVRARREGFRDAAVTTDGRAPVTLVLERASSVASP